ncbi:MAG: helix-turn-helix domain-containing protein [Agathobacter sp.]
MSIYNAGTTIRLARKEARLTQEKLSEGICTPSMLSQVENGIRGISSSAFEALMARAGKSTKAIPCFSTREDFDCFYSLKRAQFYISCWQLKSAYTELTLVESKNWANNKQHYAEWLLLHCKIQFYSGTGNHAENYQRLLHCIEITYPQLDLNTLSMHLFSINEIETLTLLAQEALYTNQASLCLTICNQLSEYLACSQFSHIDKTRLLAEISIAAAKYSLSQGEYSDILPRIEEYQGEMALLHIDMPLLQLTFLKALCLLHLGHQAEAYHLMKVVLYSAHGIDSCYFTICKTHLAQYLDAQTLQDLFPLEDVSLSSFEEPQIIDASKLSDGTYNLASPKAFTIGKLIRTLRKEQKLSAEVLCLGLCSKSKLSKIENDQQEASILLLEALLQRLGLSERPFVFFGDENEHQFNELKHKAIHSQQLRPKELLQYLEQMETLNTANDPLKKQFILFRKAFFCETPEEGLSMLFDALHCTLPQFNISRIHEYRLSWAELSILNNIAREYALTNNSLLSITYFNQLHEYYNTIHNDILLDSVTCSIMYNLYCYSLSRLEQHEQIVNTFTTPFYPKCISQISAFASFLFYYCQALGNCNQIDSATLYGNYSYAMEYLMNLFSNASKLKSYLQTDFSIMLNF